MASKGSAPAKTKKKRQKEASAEGKPTKGRKVASKTQKVAPADAAGSAEEAMENPGLMLGDFVDGLKLQPSASSSRQPSARKVKKQKAVKEDMDFAGLGLDDVEGFEEDGDDAEASARLLGNVGRLISSEDDTGLGEAARRPQAQPESEFHAGAVDEEVTVEDLLRPLQEDTSFGDVRRQLEGLAKREAMPEPVSEVKKSREERAVQYDSTSKDVKKWYPQVHRMQKAEQVSLEAEPILTKSTAEIVGHFQAVDDFEKELEEVTRAAGATEEDVRGAEALPMNPRIREEQQVRQVAQLKALMMREQQTKKRVNKIKSKTYRRIHRKSETKDREVLLERLEHENPELAKQLKQEYEKKHAEKRLLRQRNARRKWTQTMQRFAKGDRNAQQEITKQAQKAHDEEKALRRAIRGQDADQSDDSEAVDLSASEDEDNASRNQSETKRTLSKAQRLTVEEIRNLDEGGELPTSGLLGMKFMREAIKQKRESAKKEAEEVLKELEGIEDKMDDYKDIDDKSEEEEGKAPPSTTLEKDKFTEEALAQARKEVDEMLDQEDNVTGCTVAGPLTVKGVKAAEAPKAPKRRAQGPVPSEVVSTPATPASSSRPAKKVDNPWEVDANPWTGDTSATGHESKVQASGGAPQQEEPSQSVTSPAQSGKRKKKKAKLKEAEPVEEHAADDDGAEDLLGALSMDSAAAREQRELVRTAFVEGTQEDDFEAELEEEERAKDEKDKAAVGDLPGWGSWAGEGAPKPRPSKAAERAAAKAAARAAARQNATRSNAVQYDGNAESAKYFVDKVPYGIQTPEQYDQELRMPSGPEWNALPSHIQRIKPKFFSKVGAIVPPLQLVKHLPPEQRAGVIEKWAASKQPKRLKAKI
eukprot:CAMPEP_0197658690 /NCGR_PEP_ID=MMETSP1338-20131121/45382_1 /TAXON_ID=43686 ORGANISM="Pelagodinium beii, Strain RCC1491" /NCGR_SAMPLE_ID=MMETSP1338 /ASSEMBLY_ACC=CAM_ASM_000754 /LENGTH=871 /DNA_ID=CAMNT_0043235317 /DNA_START=41 /DNA_END=2656 /DNA_ORIENTATION=+